MDEKLREIIKTLESGKRQKLIKELESMNEEDFKELIEFLKSFL